MGSSRRLLGVALVVCGLGAAVGVLARKLRSKHRRLVKRSSHLSDVTLFGNLSERLNENQLLQENVVRANCMLVGECGAVVLSLFRLHIWQVALLILTHNLTSLLLFF